jgi:chemotaxis protein MotB
MDYFSENNDDGMMHRSGAWKVAYADFVTAMMALFIVLWLMGASRDVREAVSSYFRSPKGHVKLTGSGLGGSGQSLVVNQNNVGDLKAKLEHAIQDTPALKAIAPYVQFSVTGEGLRVELMERDGGMFFETGNAQPTPNGDNLFRVLSKELSRLPNGLILEGHTDSRPFRAGADSYSNWELSFDRANMARKMMVLYGVPPEQIVEIRGLADRQPLTDDPSGSRNRRISVVLCFDTGQSPAIGEE